MKNETQTKNKKWMLAAGIAVAAVIVIAAVLLMSGNNADQPIQTETTAPETTAVAEALPAEVERVPVQPLELAELVDGQIQTPYGPLDYPEYLADHLIVAIRSEAPYTLEFYAAMEGKQEVLLFDISFGEGSGGNMGMVKTQLGEVPLNVTIYTLDYDETWTEGEKITAQAMQDVVNDIMDALTAEAKNPQPESPVIATQPASVDTVDYIQIETPCCTLYYPARWSSTLWYEHDDSQEDVYKVHFYGKVNDREAMLFSIYLGGDEGEQLGAVMGADGVPVPVNLLMAELDLEGWDEESAEVIYAMQEASNQLIDALPLL